MFNSVALDVVIGLVFIYLLYSLLVSIIQEMVATNLGFRAKVLEKSIVRMLEDEPSLNPDVNRFKKFLRPTVEKILSYVHMLFGRSISKEADFTHAFYSHPLIKYMAEGSFYSKPSYIKAENFSKVMIDLLHGVRANQEPFDIQRISESIMEGKLLYNNSVNAQYQASTNELTEINEDSRLMLASFLQDSQGDINIFKGKLEQWFNDTQERASDWYKKYTQVILFTIGFCITVAFNVDTIAIVKKLSKDPKLREEMVQSAIAYSEKNGDLNKRLQEMKAVNPNVDTTTEYQNLKVLADTLYHKNMRLAEEADSLMKNDIQSVNNLLGMGWKEGRDDFNFLSFVGWVLTAIALSLGAPFWFDLLSKLIKMRGARKTESSSPTNASDQSQPVATANPVNVVINNNRQTEEEAVG